MARKITAIPGLLAEASAPAAPKAPAPQAQHPRTVRAVRRPAHQQIPVQDKSEPTVRSTLDLPASRHGALLREAADAGIDVGWSVRPQHVLRAMYDVYIDDPDAIAKVREHIRHQGRPVRRRST